jgi:hypothetical protein
MVTMLILETGTQAYLVLDQQIYMHRMSGIERPQMQLVRLPAGI